MAKAELRKRILSLVSSLSELEKQRQSEMVLRQVLAHPKFKSAKAVCVYLSTTNEIDTKPILQHVFEDRHKSCYIPLVTRTRSNRTSLEDKPRMVMTRLESMTHYDRLPLNKFGIKEPAVDEHSLAEHNLLNPCHPTLLESQVLVIVPGVAFARDGRRLGHGKGYYDEFLYHWSTRCNTGFYTLGLSLREQLVENPCAVEGQDYCLNQVLTPDSVSTL